MRRDPVRVAAIDLAEATPGVDRCHLESPALDADGATREVTEREPVEGRDVLRVDVRRPLELWGQGG